MNGSVVGAAILAVLIGLGGCGQRGPLYLPQPPKAERPADDRPADDRPADDRPAEPARR